MSQNLPPYQGLLGSWPLTDGDSVQGIGDFNRDGREEFVIQR